MLKTNKLMATLVLALSATVAFAGCKKDGDGTTVPGTSGGPAVPTTDGATAGGGEDGGGDDGGDDDGGEEE